MKVLLVISVLFLSSLALPSISQACGGGLLRGIARVITLPSRAIRNARQRRVANGRRVLFFNQAARRNARARGLMIRGY